MWTHITFKLHILYLYLCLYLFYIYSCIIYLCHFLLCVAFNWPSGMNQVFWIWISLSTPWSKFYRGGLRKVNFPNNKTDSCGNFVARYKVLEELTDLQEMFVFPSYRSCKRRRSNSTVLFAPFMEMWWKECHEYSKSDVQFDLTQLFEIPLWELLIVSICFCFPNWCFCINQMNSTFWVCQMWQTFAFNLHKILDLNQVCNCVEILFLIVNYVPT